jgi:hypothetical protein
MKHIFLFSFLTSVALAGFAQNSGAVDSSRLDKKSDTTLYGLPVHKSYVPPDAVERAKKKYGRALYSIEKSTAENCQQSYLVGLIRNGHLTMEWMCDDPKMVWQEPKENFPGILQFAQKVESRFTTFFVPQSPALEQFS